MTPSILDDPQHWRERAVEARRVADKLDDPIAKAAIIASDYGQIAEQAQLRAAGARPFPKRKR
jgi:hypothetical protein